MNEVDSSSAASSPAVAIWGATSSQSDVVSAGEETDRTMDLEERAESPRRDLATPKSSRTNPESPELEALTVDLWYTLIYPTPHVRAAIERARRAVWTESLRAHGFSAKRAQTWSVRIDRAAETAELEGWSPSWKERVERWSRRIGLPLDPDELAERFVATVPLRQVRLAPGADRALARLKRRGFRLAIVSNVTHEPPEAIHAVLAEHGLDRQFDTVILSTDVGRAKPRREPFRKALSQLGAAPGRTVHIGDAAVDFLGARAAGIRPLLYTGLARWKPDQLRRLHRPWMRGALKVGRWEDVPRAVTFYEALPPVPREVETHTR
jgi:HAD superfamily hydrolase (TIGR01509 family)